MVEIVYEGLDILDKNKSYEVVNDLLKGLLCEFKENRIEISHFRIQKTIFKIKKELGENHPLYEYLPFYWYEDGSFSIVVTKQFNELKNNNCDYYSLNEFSNNFKLINEYPSIKEISREILKDKNDFLNRFDETIYIDYAPFPFMYIVPDT